MQKTRQENAKTSQGLKEYTHEPNVWQDGSRTYFKSSEKTNNPIIKWAKDFKIQVIKEDVRGK